MTIPAVICVASACVCLYVALLTARLSRVKGWGEQRLLALASVGAAFTIAFDLAQTMADVPPRVVIVASRWQLVWPAINIAAWLYFSRIVLQLRPTWFEPIWSVTTVVLSALAVIPGVVYADRLMPPIVVPWAGATYHMPEPTAVADAVFFLDSVGLAIIAFRFTRAVLQGRHEFRWHMIGCAVCGIAGVNDCLVSSGAYVNVLLIDAGYMVPLAATAMAQTASLLLISRDLESSNAQLERALADANAAARVKDAFLANTSHELRTPLNTIINVPEGLLQHFRQIDLARCRACRASFELEPGEGQEARCPQCGAHDLEREDATVMDLEPAQVRHHLESVERSGRHLLSVVDDILNYAKLEAGAIHLRREMLSISALFEDLRHIMTPVAKKQGVALDFIQQDPAHTFRADRVRWAQVMINLISNAVKFSPPGGRVEIRAEARDGGHLFSVRDFGVGIAPEHHQMVFEAFRQVDEGPTRAAGGTGLGLALANRLVRLHAGTVSLESAIGAGSTFSVWLPAQQPASDPPIESAGILAENVS